MLDVGRSIDLPVQTRAERQRERDGEKREQQRGPNDDRARLAALEQEVATA